ncbi:MAG: MarR family transcriptional regulator [Candidatus Omnitrophica bacterium]|nr:MarR family transcriptional regulator [Candidatus Omnitrophota bacterium]
MIRQRSDAQKTSLDFGVEVAQILPLIMREFTREQKNILSKGELNIPQVVVLELLAGRSPCQMNELAKSLNLSMSAATAIVDKMVALRLVKREHSNLDRRVVNVTILSKGKQDVSRVRLARQNCVNDLFSELSEGDRREYLRILRKIADSLRKGNEI